jgi:hypothetical protein
MAIDCGFDFLLRKSKRALGAMCSSPPHVVRFLQGGGQGSGWKGKMDSKQTRKTSYMYGRTIPHMHFI